MKQKTRILRGHRSTSNPYLESALDLCDDVRVRLGVGDPHGLVVEGEALHGPDGGGGRGDLLEDDEGLAAHLERAQGHDVQDLPELREDGVERLLEVLLLDLLVQVVDVDGVVGLDVHLGGGEGAAAAASTLLALKEPARKFVVFSKNYSKLQSCQNLVFCLVLLKDK